MTPRKVLDEKIYATRSVGRPPLRWVDGVSPNARSIQNWRAETKLELWPLNDEDDNSILKTFELFKFVCI